MTETIIYCFSRTQQAVFVLSTLLLLVACTNYVDPKDPEGLRCVNRAEADLDRCQRARGDLNIQCGEMYDRAFKACGGKIKCWGLFCSR